MDITQRRISIIARGVASFATRVMRREGIGASEFDLIQMVRRHPGVTQAEVCQRLEIDKGAAARQLARLEAKGYLRRETNPADRRSRLLYEWLLAPLSPEEREELARLLEVLEPRCREEWRSGFPNVKALLADEQKRGGEPA